MKFIEVARQVVAEHAAKRIRPRAGQVGVYTADTEYDVLPAMAAGKKRGWLILDAFSASAVVNVHDQLRPENQAKLLSRAPLNVCKFALDLIARSNRRA